MGYQTICDTLNAFPSPRRRWRANASAGRRPLRHYRLPYYLLSQRFPRSCQLRVDLRVSSSFSQSAWHAVSHPESRRSRGPNHGRDTSRIARWSGPSARTPTQCLSPT